VPVQPQLRPWRYVRLLPVTLVFNIREGEIEGTDVAGLKIAAIKVTDDSVRHSVRIGDAIDFEIEDIVPFGVETGQPVRFNGMFHPVGSDLAMAEAKRSDINAFGVQYEGKTGLSTAEFAWAA
jgi:hypothetical protein